MNYIIRGYSADGRCTVSMPVEGGTAKLDLIENTALKLLEESGYKCASCTVHPIKTAGTPSRGGDFGLSLVEKMTLKIAAEMILARAGQIKRENTKRGRWIGGASQRRDIFDASVSVSNHLIEIARNH